MTFAGTGKTVIAALDYKRFLKEHARESCRFLFIAHREEILKQSLYTFRAVQKDANFGALFVGSYKPDSLDALFISIQTFNSRDFTEKVSRDFYDYIVVDEFLLRILPRIKDVDFAQFSPIEKRMLQMFYVTIWGNPIEVWNGDEMLNCMYALSDSPVMLEEMIDLLKYQYEQIDFIDEPVDVGFDCPLDLHCTYTRDQLLVALDFMKPSTVREGVKWLPDQKLDVFFVTLNKADKDYSPTTMYQDYSINEYLFHWQSQSTTSEQSPTAQRYIHHKQMGSRVLLFVREFKKDRLSGGAEAYTFLGTADYVEHEGEKPMNITWRLNAPIPAKYIKKTGKLLVG